MSGFGYDGRDYGRAIVGDDADASLSGWASKIGSFAAIPAV